LGRRGGPAARHRRADPALLLDLRAGARRAHNPAQLVELDYQSFVHNDEANATIIGHAFAREMERMFESDLASSREVTLDSWRERPIRDRGCNRSRTR
jgi:hypothetical protein